MNTSKKTQLALVYIRYSSHAQDNGNSPAAQMTCAENYTEAHQMTIEQIYHDYAKTGRNTNREGYQQMKNDILSGKVQAKIVVVRALDRLHRNTGNQIEDLKWMEAHGIRLIAVNDSVDTASEDYSKFATIVKAAAAEETSDNISKNTRAALLESARQCRHLGGVPPIGYTVNEAGLYEIDPLTAPIVRDIYTLYSSGMGYSYIKKHLKEKGYKTTGGNDFSDTAIHTILTNQKYKGTYTYDRTAAKDSDGHRNSHKIKPDPIEIPDGMPAISSRHASTRSRRSWHRTAGGQPEEPARTTTPSTASHAVRSAASRSPATSTTATGTSTCSTEGAVTAASPVCGQTSWHRLCFTQ